MRDDETLRPGNAWKEVTVERQLICWRAVIRGHALYAQQTVTGYDWWVTSDKDGLVTTARGASDELEDAQGAAMAAARELAPGALSTRAMMPSEVVAALDGTLTRLDRDLTHARKQSVTQYGLGRAGARRPRRS